MHFKWIFLLFWCEEEAEEEDRGRTGLQASLFSPSEWESGRERAEGAREREGVALKNERFVHPWSIFWAEF